jgi:ABC-type transport system involved in multi-copper enzyme maturation permease subunit
MSAVTAPASTPAPGAEAAARRPGLGRLTHVELRKMTDTRAGLWLLLATAGLTVAITVIVCLAGDAEDRVFANLVSAAIQPVALLLPVAGILLVTSEWTQRTSLITFALVPDRGRVLTAKLLAGCVLAVAATVLAVAVAGVATAIAAPDVDNVWSFSAGLFAQDLFYVVTAMITGIGMGALLLVSAPAIVLLYVLPTAWAAIGSLSFMEKPAEWLDTTRTLDPMTDELLSGGQWARALVSLALWMALPLALGWLRVRRTELR